MQFIPMLKKGLLFSVCAIALFGACKKGTSNPIQDTDDNGYYAGEASRAEWINNDVLSLADVAGNYYNGSYMRTTSTFGNCASVATDTVNNPHTLIIRFGNTNCKCLDGRYRRGTIIISYDGKYNDQYNIHTLTYQDYYVNDYKVAGNIKYSRIDTTVTGNWYYNVKMDDTILTPNLSRIVWRGSLVRKWIAGYNTGEREDNVYSISGAATLIRPNGHQFSFDIATPLTVSNECDYISSGKVNVFGYGKTYRVLDYAPSNTSATGECDNVAQLNADGHIYPLKMD